MGVGEQGRATGRQDVVRTATRSSATETIYSFTRAANSAKTRREEKDVRKWESPPPPPPSPVCCRMTTVFCGNTF